MSQPVRCALFWLSHLIELIHRESPLASASILLIKVGEVDHTLASGYELLLSLEMG
ncbi:hypothetical protein [Sporosarcina sp. P18a]|uniref:hypothetical protein n=1 Tax=Sporosarcina sp. P18a TaxID=2048259 RepID=UPI0013041A72|nr:hypothetical protein [Sporosarcina sp. P18a]